MADIWSSIGAEITTSEGEWLYRVGSEVRGPVAEAVLSNRLANGEIPLSTLVAREGGEFHPVGRVATFTKSVKIAQKNEARKRRKRIVLAVSIASLVLGAAGSAAAYVIWKEAETKRLEAVARAEREADALEKKRAELEQSTKGPELVALVSLGSEEEVQIRQEPKRGKRPKRRPGNKPGAAPEPEESVASCSRSQGAILSTLKSHLAKINVCVQDEKTRDAANLPNQLSLEFVVQTSGSVTDFRILNRHYRSGPMNNCMIKVFRRVKYPSATGSNCPVTIPIKIGS
ncbi:MAG: AgmX/PglI C-terminal domain-containing protein [Myxococcota bacterium]